MVVQLLVNFECAFTRAKSLVAHGERSCATAGSMMMGRRRGWKDMGFFFLLCMSLAYRQVRTGEFDDVPEASENRSKRWNRGEAENKKDLQAGTCKSFCFMVHPKRFELLTF